MNVWKLDEKLPPLSKINLVQKLCQAFDVGTDLIKTLQSVYLL